MVLATGEPYTRRMFQQKRLLRLLGAFSAHHVPVTGFVIQKQVESLGAIGCLILREWINQGLDEQIEEEIVRDESGFEPPHDTGREEAGVLP